MKDSVIDTGMNPTARSRTGSETTGSREMEPMELALWLQAGSVCVSERWLAEIVARGGTMPEEVAGLMDRFIRLFVSFLPASLGPYHEQVDPLWRQAAELYGSLGAMRGLAAGEIIEEFQLLREALLRHFDHDPPDSGLRIGLRETLRLNRMIDRGVTHASVAHTDSLFFSLFQGSGVPEALTPEVMQEVRDQLMVMEREFTALMRLLD
ncbi:MAG: hypothetical protein WDZ89_04090 [Gemmatimonadota bacterium]